MHWPAKIEAGTRCDQPITSVDFMPTFAEISGAALPTNQPVDGVSILPLFESESFPERAIFWHYPLYTYQVVERERWFLFTVLKTCIGEPSLRA